MDQIRNSRFVSKCLNLPGILFVLISIDERKYTRKLDNTQDFLLSAGKKYRIYKWYPIDKLEIKKLKIQTDRK